MKKGQVVTGKVVGLQFPNKGICEVADTDTAGNACVSKCMVKNVIPGQTVSIQIQKKRKGAYEGRVVELIEEAPNEVCSACEHFGVCGGCNYQTLPYEEQLKIKESQVEQLLWDAIKDTDSKDGYVFEGIKRSPVAEGYRNKMEFTFGDEYKDGPLALGMHKRGSFHDIVTVSGCRIMDEDYRTILKVTLDFFKNEPVKYFHRMRHEGYLRHLLVRKAGKTGEILIALVTSSQIDAAYEKDVLDRYRDILIGLHNAGRVRDLDEAQGLHVTQGLQGKIAGILHIVNDSLADVVQSDRTDVLWGQEYFYEELLGLRFKISAFSFFQNNSPAAEVLYETAREYLGDIGGAASLKDTEGGKSVSKGTVLYDLYSGTGTITQMMAPVVYKAIGVEIVEEAVIAARENAKLNGLHNCEFIANDVMKALDDIEEKPDYIILDPPRDGIHPKALKQILSYDVDKMVYISCKPTSLARDLEIILNSGYQIKKAVAVDLFPGTVHCETVVLLSRQIDLHKMKLKSAPFEMIKGGKKTIELRLYDEKRQKIKVGDKILFTNNTTGETLNTTVVKLHRYDSFAELYKNLPLLQCGYTVENVDKATPADMERYYSVEEQERYGVVGIEIC